MPHDSQTWREAAVALDAGHASRARAIARSLRQRRCPTLEAYFAASIESELALFSGDNTLARELALSVSPDKASPEALARAASVLAVVHADGGDRGAATAYAERARGCLARGVDQALAARIACRLVAIQFDISSLNEANAAIGNALSLARASGEPTAIAHLHALSASLNGRRGLTDRAWWHLAVAREILSYARHPVVDVVCSVTSMIVASLEDDHEATVTHGKEALEQAVRIGFGRLIPRIQNNLGLGLLRTGELQSATALFEKAVAAHLPTTTLVGVSDSLAQLYLVTGQHHRCASLIERASRALGEDKGSYTWYRLGLFETSIELGLATSQDGSLHDSLAAKHVATAAGHRNFECVFALLLARALVRTGEHRAASELVATTVGTTAGEVALTTIGRREAVLAEIGCERGDWALARMHIERAKRVLMTVGTPIHRRQVTDVEHKIADGLAAKASAPPSDGSPSFESVCFLVECAANPEVLARETLSQLELSQAVEAAVLSWGTSRKEPRAKILTGGSPPTRPADIDIAVGARHLPALLQVWTQGPPVGNQMRLIARVAEVAVAQRDLLRRDQGSSDPEQVFERLSDPTDLVLDAASMQPAIRRVDRVAPTPLSVLFLGETGTGKEVMARLLHARSSRRDMPFVPFNCASVPMDLIDAHLFGHCKGSFTGAISDSVGVIRSADGGTLFLDEIGELPLAAQPKLLRFLERGEVHPIGASMPTVVDVRVVAATNGDLRQMVRSAAFREDLYFRLNGITIEIPPLRQRVDDIPRLAKMFIGRYAAAMGRRPPSVSPAAMELLLMHPWPGNVRQLANEMRRIVALAPAETEISAAVAAEILEFPGTLGDHSGLEGADAPGAGDPGQSLDSAVAQLERRMILAALENAGGRVAEAAASLGLSRKGLFLKRRRLGIG